jgi:GDP-L-fucose synthase
MADACVTLMNLPDEKFVPLLGQNRNDGLAPLVNIGVGHDLGIRELAETVAEVVGFKGALEFDARKPDGTPRKLMDVGRLSSMGWHVPTEFRAGWSMPTRVLLKNMHDLFRNIQRETAVFGAELVRHGPSSQRRTT